MNCWLCKRAVYSGYLNPFTNDSQLCDECHRCVETTFDEEKASAARLFHELCQKSGLSILQLEESWIHSRLKAVEKVSEAAYVDDKLESLRRRQSELTVSWEDNPPHRPDVAEFMDDYFWALYAQANQETQDCLDRAGKRALQSSRQLSSLHVLLYLTNTRAETVAHTLLTLAGFSVKRTQRELVIALNSEVPVKTEEAHLTAELSAALVQGLESCKSDRWGTHQLLQTILHEESLAHKFLSERCNLDVVLELLAKSQGLP